MSLLRLAVFPLVLSALGCSEIPERCPRVAGQFSPNYTPLAVSQPAVMVPPCAEGPEQRVVAIDDTPKPVQMNTVVLSTGQVTTEVVRRGCSVQLTQVYESPGPGQPQFILAANDLTVHSANEISGPLSMTRFDAQGRVACWSAYHAHLRKGDDTTGAAAMGTPVGAGVGTAGAAAR